MLRLLLPCCLLVSPILFPAMAQDGPMEEIVVTGHLPGPRLWKVSKGEHVLWILPTVSIVPKNMIWDDDRVAAIIAAADEAIGSPNVSVGVSKRLLLNPFNVVRAIRLFSRVERNPDNAVLADVLPDDIYRRYTVLKARYLPRDKKVDKLRPFFASQYIRQEVLAQEQLTGFEGITRHLARLIRKNRSIRETDVKVDRNLEGSYRELSQRVVRLTDSMALDHEIGCFDAQLTLLENHLEDVKQQANAWATGDVRGMQDLAQAAGMNEPCMTLFMSSSESALLQELMEESIQRWLDAAIAALEHSHSTFTRLPMMYITGDLSLVNKLAQLGYQVHAPK